jgi:hypothetical protein
MKIDPTASEDHLYTPTNDIWCIETQRVGSIYDPRFLGVECKSKIGNLIAKSPRPRSEISHVYRKPIDPQPHITVAERDR